MSDKLQPVLEPCSIALVGASADLSRQTGRPLYLMQKRGFAGALYPVNPRREEIGGLRCYRSLRDIGQPIDLALVLTPAAAVPAAIEDGVAAGVRSFVVYAAGFGEAGAEGQAAQAHLAEIAQDRGVSIVGPNCVGVINARNGLCATWASGAETLTDTPGEISFVGQSGAIGSYWLDFVTRAGVGFAKWVTTGNEADVSVADVIEHLAADEATSVITVYLESAKSGPALRRALERAAAAGKPVIAMRAGRSAAGAEAAASHTGAMAGADEVWSGLFRQFDVIDVRSMTEMFDLARLRLKRPGGSIRSPAIVSISGGAGVLITDAFEEAGLPVVQPSAECERALTAIMPSFAQSRNPLDLTAELGRDPGLLGRVLSAVCADATYDSLIIFLGLVHRIAPELSRALREALSGSALPACVVWIGALSETVAEIEGAGIPVYPDIPPAIAAMAAYGRLARRTPLAITRAPPAPHRLMRGALLSEWGSQQALGPGWPLPFPEQVLITGRGAASQAATVALPRVAKLQSATMPHKTEYGGVVLGLRDNDATGSAVAGLFDIAQRLGIGCEGVLVQRMVPHEMQLVLGLRCDPSFGPIMVIGRGGTEAELEPDIAIRLLPASAGEIEAALRGLRCSSLFAGFRGRPPVDLAAVAASLEALGRFYLDRTDLAEIEINPLGLAGPATLTGLDALVRLTTDQP